MLYICKNYSIGRTSEGKRRNLDLDVIEYTLHNEYQKVDTLHITEEEAHYLELAGCEFISPGEAYMRRSK